MKQKGFTLIELLAVIVILGIIAVITTANIYDVFKTSKKSLGNEQKLAIENSARIWGLKNVSFDEPIPFVSIKTLLEDKALEKKEIANLKVTDDSGVCICKGNEQLMYYYADEESSCTDICK